MASAPPGAEVLGGVAEVMDLDFPLEDADWEMMVAGPADDQYNEILDKEVLQQLCLFGTAADTAAAAAAGPPPPREVPMLLQQPGGGLSGLGGAARQVAELLAGTHPSMRGTSLEDWLNADGPIVAITATGVPDAGAGGRAPSGPAPTSAASAAAAAAAAANSGCSPTHTGAGSTGAQPSPGGAGLALAEAHSMPMLHPHPQPAMAGGDLSLSQGSGSLPLGQQLQMQQIAAQLMAAAAPLMEPQQQQHAGQAQQAQQAQQQMAQMQAQMLAQQQHMHEQQQSMQHMQHMLEQLGGGEYGGMPPPHPPPAFFPDLNAPAASTSGWQAAPPPAMSMHVPLTTPQQLAGELMALFGGGGDGGMGGGPHALSPSGSSGATESVAGGSVAGGMGGMSELEADAAAAALLITSLSGLQGIDLQGIDLQGQLSGLQGFDLQGVTAAPPAAAAPAAPAAPPPPMMAHAHSGHTDTTGTAPGPSITFGHAGSMEEDGEDDVSQLMGDSSGGFNPGSDSLKPTTLKRFSDRQKNRISKIESELAKLQRSMHQMKLENEKLKSKNTAVEQQLRTQQQLQELAAAVTTASAAAAAAAEHQQQMAGGGGGSEQGHAGSLLSLTTGRSPPNSQKKLLLQLSDSMRPQDKEMMAVAALTWPKLREWYAKLVLRFRDSVQRAASLSPEEAEKVAKEALRSGRYWDLLVLISRPDLSTRLLREDIASGEAAADPAAAAAWPSAAVQAMQLSEGQRAALATAWQHHRQAAGQRAARRQELLSAIRCGFLVHLQKASPEDIELGKPLARQGLGAMEALRLVVRQEHVSAVQISCGLRKVLSSVQQARLAVAAWPCYPDPAKWAPLLCDRAD